MNNQWINALREKATELEIIASWASLVNLGKVRDACRIAKSEILSEIKRLEEN